MTPTMTIINNNLSPIIQSFTTPDLIKILKRSNLNSIKELLIPFKDSIENINIRLLSNNLISKQFNKFPIEFIERFLPKDFSDLIGEGVLMSNHHRRSSVLSTLSQGQSSPSSLPHTTLLESIPDSPQFESNSSLNQQQPPSSNINTTSTTTTTTTTSSNRGSISFSHPTSTERDELFLDSLSDQISLKAEGWLNPTTTTTTPSTTSSTNHTKEELSVKTTRINKKKYEEPTSTTVDIETNVDKVERDEGWEGRKIEELTPWYTTMRDQIFSRRELVEWETFAWPVGVLLALSTSHPDPLGALSALWDLTSREKLFSAEAYPIYSEAEGDGRKDWANPDVLRYIVLVHDFGAGGGRDGWEDAQVLHETIRKTYGIHTALLPIFSACLTSVNPQPKARGLDILWPSLPLLPSSPLTQQTSLPSSNSPSAQTQSNPNTIIPMMERGGELSEGDLKALRVFMREMVVQSLIPFMERLVVVGNEQWNSSKRSIGGRLFSAGRKYFGGSNSSSRAGSPVSTSTTPTGFNSIKGWYPFTAQESQTRRLGDLAFMIGDYKLAMSVYEYACKDFKNDKAWKYYSSACRMTGLSQLMLHPPSTPLNFNPDQYLEQALQVPGISNGVDLEGLKVMMMYYELYRYIGDWRPASEGLVRTAGEADEVSSALLLEQAAISDLHLPRASKRKFAFHMAMAAKRYEKTGLKSLSRRCLSQAASVYHLDQSIIDSNGSGWDGIRSHLYYGLGRQAYNVGKAEEAVEHFLELLVGATPAIAGEIGEGEEESWLDDFGLAWEHLSGDTERVLRERNLKLHATIFNPKDVKVRLIQNGDISTLQADGSEWEELAAVVSGPIVGSASRKIGKATAEVLNQVSIGETFYLELIAQNPLNAPLAIGGLQIETNAPEGVLEIDAPKELELGAGEALRIFVPIRANSLADFKFTRVSFRFNDLLPCTESLTKKPKRLNATRDQLVTPTYEEDTSLSVTIRPPTPILSVSLDKLPDTLYAGEARMSSITLTNTGQVALMNLKAVSSHPSFVLFQPNSSIPSSTLYNKQSASNASNTLSSPNYLLPNPPFEISLGAPASSQVPTLEAGASINIPVLCRGDAGGNHSLKFLFTFSAIDNSEILFSRTLRELHIQPSIRIRPQVRPSNSPSIPFLLVLETFNLALPSDFIITQITSISPQWKCTLLDGFSLKDDLAPIAFQQSSSLYLSVESAVSIGVRNEEEDGAKFAARKIDSLLQGREVKGSHPSDILLYHNSNSSSEELIDTTSSALFSSILQTHILLRHASLSAQLPTINSSLHQYLFPLFNSRSLDLLVFWTSPSRNLSGHHHLAGIPIGAGSNVLKAVLETAELKAGGLYAESQRERSILLAGLRRSEFGIEDDPSAVILQVADVSDHEFGSGPCSIVVTFYIRNCSISTSYDYTLSLQPAETISSLTRLTYSGSLTHRGTVAPLEVAKVKVKAWVQSHGVYEAGNWSLEILGVAGQSWRRFGTSREVRINDISVQ